MINRKVFFAEVRPTVFNGSLLTGTVRGCNAILDEWERRGLTDLRWLAYKLATARGECGVNMLPVREGFAKTDEAARSYVARQGYKYAKEINGHVYYGRGLVQLTWDFNYKKMGDLLNIDLVNNPDRALEPRIAAAIMFEGMIRGTFTGKKLADYFNEVGTDFLNARRIINGMDRAQQFATWGKQFHAALIKAKDAVQPDVPAPIKPAPAPKSGNVAGTGAVIVATGAGAVIAKQASDSGASTSQIAIVVGLTLIIAIAAFFVVRQLFKRD